MQGGRLLLFGSGTVVGSLVLLPADYSGMWPVWVLRRGREWVARRMPLHPIVRTDGALCRSGWRLRWPRRAMRMRGW